MQQCAVQRCSGAVVTRLGGAVCSWGGERRESHWIEGEGLERRALFRGRQLLACFSRERALPGALWANASGSEVRDVGNVLG